MKTEFDKQTSDVGVLASASILEGQSRLPFQGVLRTAGTLLLAATYSGCATSNYDFDALADVSGQSRVARMSEDWLLKNNGKEDKGLYDIHVIPLAHTRLSVFAEADDEGIPEGFVEADIDAYLPLFGFLDVMIRRYDSDRRMYEQQEYSSYCWGLFQTHRELIDTAVGMREEKRRRFLWFFGWKSSPKYIDAIS